MHLENQVLEIGALLLFIATVVGLVTRRWRLPYTVGLVFAGLLLGLLNSPEISVLPEGFSQLIVQVTQTVTPSLILGLLVTPLIFEAAFHLSWEDLRRDLVFILVLAIPGVVLTTAVVGLIIASGANFPIQIALVFGALMSATDPVAVVALFRSLGVPKRLQVLIEGESLFNDGTAIVIFSLVVALAAGGQETGASSAGNWIQIIAEFLRVAGGGIIIGLLSGWMVSLVIREIDDYLIETALTIVLAFGTYLLAERFEVSGVLAVVAAGLVNGNIGPRGMSPTTRIVVFNFWEALAFLSNSFVFLLIGLEINLAELGIWWQTILLAILAVLVSRALILYPLIFFFRNYPFQWGHILLWGGLRGAISLALALSLPQILGSQYGTPLRVMAFGVVLFTIVVQGFTMQPLVRGMQLIKRSEGIEEYERRHARAVAARLAYSHLQQMYREGLFSHHTWQILHPLLEEHSQSLATSVKEILEANPSLEDEEMDTARREALRAQRSALIGLLTDGVISEEIYNQLAREVDMALDQDQHGWAGMIDRSSLRPIRYLMTAIIQLQDYENAARALNQVGLPVTQLASSGGFLGRRNVTLLIGMGENQEELAVKTLARTCRRRVEYVATPLEGAPFHLPLSTPITVGGATIFTFQVERFEEL